jgi:methionyl-tRNA formyltransferase
MKLLFIGCVESSYILLNELLETGVNICGVITKKTSEFNSDFVDLTPLCYKHKIDVFLTENSNDIMTIDFIKSKNPDIIYCFGWSYLLCNEIISLPRLGIVGFHPAKLPNNKGRHPLIWALVLGLKSTASTFFMIDEKADNGDIISQIDIEIEFTDDARMLYNKVMAIAKKQVIQITEAFSHGTVNYIQQSQNDGNVWRKRTKNDGKIDFRMSAVNIYNLIRGLTRPYVGANFEYLDKEYKSWKSKVIYDYDGIYNNIEYGKVIEIYSKTSFLVKTGEHLIKIIESDEINLNVGDYL